MLYETGRAVGVFVDNFSGEDLGRKVQYLKLDLLGLVGKALDQASQHVLRDGGEELEVLAHEPDDASLCAHALDVAQDLQTVQHYRLVALSSLLDSLHVTLTLQSSLRRATTDAATFSPSADFSSTISVLTQCISIEGFLTAISPITAMHLQAKARSAVLYWRSVRMGNNT